MVRLALRLTVVLMVLAAGAAALGTWAYVRYDAPGPHADAVTVIIEPGSGVDAIARQLAASGVLERPLVFRFGVRLTRVDKALRAGEYAIPARASPRAIAALLQSGKTVVHRLTVVEGSTSHEVVRLLREAEPLAGDIVGTPPEGSMLPETYHFSRGDSRDALATRMAADMQAVLDRLWRERDTSVPLKSPTEALILASIVEKETGVPAERPHIAAVFHNRLRRGMRLQSDPTVIYALTDGAAPLERALTRADLNVASPYNTYVASGLPPGPICNPGAAAIAAVLRPATSEDLYFVADGTGGHAFARTLAEHNANVLKWRRLQREGDSPEP